jgi:hypothetical protein
VRMPRLQEVAIQREGLININKMFMCFIDEIFSN